MTEYPDRWSDVEIVMNDGTIETHTIKVGSSFMNHMAKQAGETGVLTLLCGKSTYAYPLANVRSWSLTERDGSPS